MKVIKKESIHDDEDIDCVQTEKNVFEIATNHPFLVGLHSCFQTPSRLIFVIEFVSGGDLMYHMQRQKKLPEEHGRFYAAEICSALHYLHDKGIIYRDLKLDNVLLGQFNCSKPYWDLKVQKFIFYFSFLIFTHLRIFGLRVFKSFNHY